jgi:hypothetical protein
MDFSSPKEPRTDISRKDARSNGFEQMNRRDSFGYRATARTAGSRGEASTAAVAEGMDGKIPDGGVSTVDSSTR